MFDWLDDVLSLNAARPGPGRASEIDAPRRAALRADRGVERPVPHRVSDDLRPGAPSLLGDERLATLPSAGSIPVDDLLIGSLRYGKARTGMPQSGRMPKELLMARLGRAEILRSVDARVGYSSKSPRGHLEIAEAIAAGLKARGIEADLRRLGEIEGLEGYDIVGVLGGAIFLGAG